jgi:hypothetical protein
LYTFVANRLRHLGWRKTARKSHRGRASWARLTVVTEDCDYSVTAIGSIVKEERSFLQVNLFNFVDRIGIHLPTVLAPIAKM